jgi:hypothetical protein
MSEEEDVLSGVPQGSVLGPCLFLLLYYINDLPNGLASTVRLFADDTITYMAITSPDSPSQLQDDLRKLEEWEDKWKMEFHPDKCQVISFTRNHNPTLHKYTLHNCEISHTDTARYLGITISKDLRWNRHINQITAKASSTLSFLRRNLQVNNQHLKESAYFALVRPHLEYAASVWDPHTTRNIKQLEMIQRTAARYTCNQWDRKASVTKLLQDLEWSSLQDRRSILRLTQMYKYHNKQVAMGNGYAEPISKRVRGTHSATYLQPHSNTDIHKYSFFPRTIREWNKLPQSAISAPSPDAFRSHIKAILKNSKSMTIDQEQT